MNEMQVFQNSEFGELGVLEVNGKPYFPATACAKILGYANPRKAILDHCKEDRVTKRDVIDTLGRTQSAKFINEGNLYRLIVKAADQSASETIREKAERFEKWVFDEVLPTIRRTGSYSASEAQTVTMEQMVQLATAMATIAAAMENIMTHLPQPGEQPPTMTAAWRANYHPGPRKKVVATPPGNGILRMETFPPDVLSAVNSMMEQMVEEQTLNFSEIARYCNKMGCTISNPSVRRYYDKYYNQH